MSNNLATQETTLAKSEQTVSEKFVARIEKQFISEMGSAIAWTPLQKTLAQHLYVRIDEALRTAETRRWKENDPAVTWDNVDMMKLAIDGVRIVNFELDALIKNHVNAIPYLNGRTKKYEVNLRPGYVGEAYTHQKFGIGGPRITLCELVHEGDTVDESLLKATRGTEGFKRANPFKPGEVIGGIGYIAYDDMLRDQLVYVEYREFEKAMKASGAVEFWGGVQSRWEGSGQNRKKVAGDPEKDFDEKFRKEMQYKTVVLRVSNKIPLDPAKINVTTWNEMLAQDLDEIEAQVQAEIAQKANREVIQMPALGGPNPVGVVIGQAVGEQPAKEEVMQPEDAKRDTGRVLSEPSRSASATPAPSVTGPANQSGSEDDQDDFDPLADDDETPAPEPPVSAPVTPEPPVTPNTQVAPKRPETPNNGQILTDDQKTEIKLRLAKISADDMTAAGYRGNSYTLFMAKLKADGVTDYASIDQILEAFEE